MYLDLFVSLISLKYNNWDEIKKKKITLFSWAGKYFSEKVQCQVKVPIRKN